MDRRRFNKFNRGRRFDRSRRPSFGNQPAEDIAYIEQDLGKGPSKDFRQVINSNSPIDGIRPLEPQRSRVQNYDETIDGITNVNIYSSDEMYGAETPTTNIDYGTHSELGTITGAVENKFMNDEHSMIAERSRTIYHYESGINLMYIKPEGENIPLANLAYATAVSQIVSQLRSLVYTDDQLHALKATFITDKESLPDNCVLENGKLEKLGFTPLMAEFLGYQTEVSTLATMLGQYKTLLAMMPLLKRRYYQLSKTFSYIETNLKRAKFRGAIQQLERAISFR